MHREQVATLAGVGCATIGGITQGLGAISKVAAFSAGRPGRRFRSPWGPGY